jgi:radical SAM protein with 4Fe4S-binding SPASM domain
MVIKKIKEAGIKNIRFTGGEPLLRPDILEILKYAKSLGFREVRLNTNGSLIDEKMALLLTETVDNFLIPLEGPDAEAEMESTGIKDSFDLKLKAISYLAKAGAKIIRVGTVATSQVISDLEKVSKIIRNLPIRQWELYRPIPVAGGGQSSRKDIELLVEKFSVLKKQDPGKEYIIANALPFCSVKNMNLIDSLSVGAIYDDGHSRFVIDPRGFAKPHYFIDENIGDPLDPIGCWNHPFMKKMRNLEFLPTVCKNCRFKLKCRGGSRFAAKMYYGKYDALDPLMP